MRETCDNCGQPVLTTDSICWHCGNTLPARPAETAPPPQQTAQEEAAPQTEAAVTSTPDRSRILAYGSLTLVLFIAMMLVMRSLGNYPLVVVNPDTRLGVDWDQVEGTNGRYVVALPEDWRRWQPDAPPFDTRLAEDSRFQAALFPLAAIAEDTTYLLLVLTNHHSAAEAPGFLAVGQSERLAQVSLPQVIELVQQSPAITIRQAEIAPGLTGQDQVHLELDFARDGDVWRCEQRIVSGEGRVFLIGTCAMPNDYIRYGERFADVLLSFQPLQ